MDAGYSIEVLPTAEGNLDRIIAWHIKHRSRELAANILERFREVMQLLVRNPWQWQCLPPPHAHLRKAILTQEILLFYQVMEERQRVQVIAIRGAAEDWTNQPLPTD